MQITPSWLLLAAARVLAVALSADLVLPYRPWEYEDDIHRSNRNGESSYKYISGHYDHHCLLYDPTVNHRIIIRGS